MGYYMAPRPADIQSPILHPQVEANNFEIKPAVVTMIQDNALFHGHATESPREHVQRFLELAGSLKINGMPAEAFPLFTSGESTLVAKQPHASFYNLMGRSSQQIHVPLLPSFEDGRVEKEDYPFRARRRRDLE
ncbi:unnamed protein product [Linum trigynum]|uniref:Uncharacterized protein n=1 Tax=Linum trigynum TaxID=586398 RepID=A0AAV2EQW5_9ROSI